MSAATVERYLDRIAAGLDGPRRRRARILAELRDGLDDAVNDQTAHGVPDDQAVAAAIVQFGTPEAITAAFTEELATASARHTLAWFVVTGPMVGVWWLLLMHPEPWRAGLVALLAAIPVLPLVVVALATAAGTLATTGRLMRWLPEAGARRAVAAARAVALVVATGDVLIIGVYAHSGIPLRALAVVALAASLTRIGCAMLAARRASKLLRRL
jgi:hypothetical protein